MGFDKMRNGYNRYQVDDAINQLNVEKELLTRQIEAYRLQSEEDNKKYEELKTKYDALVLDLEVKEKAANELASLALKEANEIIQSANCNADAIIKEALESAQEILVNISKLGIEAKGIKENMKDQMDALNNAIESFDVPPIPNSKLLKKCDE